MKNAFELFVFGRVALVAGWMENHIETEPHRFTAFNLSCLYKYLFFIHICFGFDETKLTKEKLY